MSCGPGGSVRLAAAFLLLLVGVTEVCAKCPSGFFECSNGACIRESKRCDHKKDCPDGVDELHCDNIKCEAPFHWKCEDGRCIQTIFKCDGNNDCGDWSDEKDCNASKVSDVQKMCSGDDFPCGDGTCIPDSWVCDGLKDCQNGNDEVLGCSKKLDCGRDFLCSNHHCIPKSWECDGNNDCGDNSDEVNCKPKDVTEGCTLDKNLFGCHDKLKCVEVTEVCDGTPHCLDGSDEGPMCQKSKVLCTGQGCSFRCQPTPSGPICLCPVGFNLVNKKYCTDIDECQLYGICSQKCRNSNGSYSCYCNEGYTLQSDNHTCTVNEGEAVLLFSTKTEVRAYFMSNEIYLLVAEDQQHVAGVAYDGLYVYWTSVRNGEEAIVRSNHDGSVTDVLVSSGLSLPEDLALDLITGNIYFTDGEESYIGVCTKTGTECTVLVNEDVRKPRGIALLMRDGTMFWSDWGSKKPMIATAGMDGSSPHPFLVGVHWPNGITIDLGNERLYWVDAKLQSIESVKLDGTDRRVILETPVKHPFSIAVFENTLYWSDWEDRQIASCHKFTGKNQKVLLRSLKNHIYGIKVYHPTLHPSVENRCKDAGCSDICMLAPNNSYTCACPVDKELGFDQHSCRVVLKKEVVVAVAGNRIVQVEHRLLGRQMQSVMLAKSIRHADAVVYSSIDDMLIISDSDEKKLFSMVMSTNVIKPLLEKGIGTITSLSFDAYGNNVYWTDAELATVEAMSMNTKTVAVLLRSTGAEPPLSVAVIPNWGYMFVAFGSSAHVHVDRILMDGSGQRVHVLEEVSGSYVSLWYDDSLDRVFIADSGTHTIGSLASDGVDYHDFKHLSGSPASVTALGQDLFWSVKGQGSLFWANKFDGASKVKKLDLMAGEDTYNIPLTAVRGVSLLPNHPCHRGNGGCSHLCLMREHQQVCGCPEGMFLRNDNVTCLVPPGCSVEEFRCEHDKRCIPVSHRCNGVNDCPSGEDERNCVVCGEHEFTCSNGQCVSLEGKCDGIVQCSDGSDERVCNGGMCDAESDFECKNGRCVAKSLLCDLTDDCQDGSDEENCGKATCGVSEFRCHSGACIPATWECDGEVNCADSTDEHDNCTMATCGPKQFSCGNGHCVDRQLLCNLVDDCGDDSDESSCQLSGNSSSTTCSGEEFSCWSRQGLCIALVQRCDGKPDCPKAEDEWECACAVDEFECRNGKCISTGWLCDKNDDCGDASDEDPSRCMALHTGEAKAVCKGFECDHGKCLELEQLCDGIRDCEDGSDEGGKCGKACIDHPCGGECRATPAGAHCYCTAGYELGRDGKSCHDVDECRVRPPLCSQVCSNSPGSFSCGCVDGFVLRLNRVSCKATGPAMEYVLVTGGKQIRKVSQSLASVDVVHKQDFIRITGLDIDAREQAICWSTRETGTIYCQSVKTQNKTYVEGVGQPTELAVDWITKNIYYVDEVPTGQSHIRVCHLAEKLCAVVVVAEHGSRITNIAVDPLAGFLFWTEVNALIGSGEVSTGSVWRADLAGGSRRVVAQSDLGTPSGVALDTVWRVIYWADATRHVVEAAMYDGKQRVPVFTSEVKRLKRLVLFEDKLYWLQEHSGFVMKCGLLAKEQRCQSVHINVYDGDYLTILQESRQRTGINPCEHHRCSHMCTVTPLGAKCLCADGQIVGENIRCKSKGAKVSEPQFFISGVVRNLKTSATANQPSGESEGTASSSLVIVLVIVIIVICLAAAAAAYYIYKRQLFTFRDFNLRIRFQKTGFSRQPMSISKGARASQSAEHEFVNPINVARRLSVTDTERSGTSFPQPMKKMRVSSQTALDTSESESEVDFPVSGKVDKMRLLP